MKNTNKQCPNCGGYKTFPVYGVSGFAIIGCGSCLGLVLFFVLLPILPFIWAVGLIFLFYDWYLIAKKKPRPFKCQSCHYQWKE